MKTKHKCIAYLNRPYKGTTTTGTNYMFFSIWCNGMYWNCVTFNQNIIDSAINKAEYELLDFQLSSYKKTQAIGATKIEPKLVINEWVATGSVFNSVNNNFNNSPPQTMTIPQAEPIPPKAELGEDFEDWLNVNNIGGGKNEK